MTLLILGLIVFIGAHAVPIFAPQRRAMVERYGEMSVKGLVGLLSLVGIVAIFVGYGQARFSGIPPLYQPPFWMGHITLVLMIPSIILLVAAYVPCRIKAWTKHPMLASIKIWAVAHLLANGEVQSVLLFGSFLVWAIVARISAKRRERNGYLTPYTLPADTPAANDLIVVVIGATIYVAILLWLHQLLFGMPVMPG